MKSKLAVLDVDDTLYPGALAVSLFKEQIKKDLFNRHINRALLNIYKAYKEEKSKDRDVSLEAVEVFAKGMNGIAKKDLTSLADKVWAKEKNNFFPFVEDLISLLRSKDLTPAFLSGSPSLMIEKAADRFGIEVWWGSQFETKDSIYTGKIVKDVSPLSGEDKVRILKDYAQKIPINWSDSFAIGDSIRERGVFNLVGKPCAFEPGKNLEELAKQKGWPIADRNNVLQVVESML